MQQENLNLEVRAPDTVLIGTVGTGDATGVWTNVSATVFVCEAIDVGMIGNSSSNSGSLSFNGPGSGPFFFFDGDTSTSGGLYRPWRGLLVVYNTQQIAFSFTSGDPTANWGLTISGHWELGYQPNPG